MTWWRACRYLVWAVALVAALLAISVGSRAPAEERSKGSLPAPLNTAVVSVRRINDGRRFAPACVPIFAVWSNGVAVCGYEQGSTFRLRQFNVFSNEANELCAGLRSTGLSTDGTPRKRSYAPFDCDVVRIDAKSPLGRGSVESWHEIVEANTNRVVVGDRIEELNGRTKKTVLATAPDDYRAFRETWRKCRELVMAVCRQAGVEPQWP